MKWEKRLGTDYSFEATFQEHLRTPSENIIQFVQLRMVVDSLGTLITLTHILHYIEYILYSESCFCTGKQYFFIVQMYFEQNPSRSYEST